MYGAILQLPNHVVTCISAQIKHMKKYGHVHTACGSVRFRKLQSVEMEHVFNSADSCILCHKCPQWSMWSHADRTAPGYWVYYMGLDICGQNAFALQIGMCR